MVFFVSCGRGQWFVPAQNMSAIRCEAGSGTAGHVQFGIVVCLGRWGQGNLQGTVFGAGSVIKNRIVPGVILGQPSIRGG